MPQVYNYFSFGIDLAKTQISAPYDPQNFSVGYAKESGLVPALLAPIWLLFPYLQVSLIGMGGSPQTYPKIIHLITVILILVMLTVGRIPLMAYNCCYTMSDCAA